MLVTTLHITYPALSAFQFTYQQYSKVLLLKPLYKTRCYMLFKDHLIKSKMANSFFSIFLGFTIKINCELTLESIPGINQYLAMRVK